MKKVTLALLCILLLSGCTGTGQPDLPSQSPEPTAESPALPEQDKPEPALCNGFGLLNWGDDYHELFDADAAPEGARLDDEFAGYPCGAYYSFHEETGLYAGWYQFNEDHTGDGILIYQALREAVVELYGEHEPNYTQGDDGQMTTAPTIEDVIAAGGGQCSELWDQIKTSRDERVMLTLQLRENEEVLLSFTNPDRWYRPSASGPEAESSTDSGV